MQIEHAARDGCIVVTLVGQLDLAAAPKVRRALLKHLADQPDAVICDLAGVARIDPACASVFAAVAHRPRSRWPDSHLLLCGARPAVAAALTRQGTPRFLPVYATLDQALGLAFASPVPAGAAGPGHDPGGVHHGGILRRRGVPALAAGGVGRDRPLAGW